MSKLFYDHLIVFEEIEVELDQLKLDREEREEVEKLIDELIHHRVLDRILTYLPRHHHAEFLTKFHAAPYDHKLLSYLDARIEASVEEHVKDEVEKLKEEILQDIKSSRPQK